MVSQVMRASGLAIQSSAIVGRRLCEPLVPGLASSSYPGVVAVLDIVIYQIIWFAAIPVGVFAFVHAVLQRSDAYTAADKLTKPAWLGITGGGAAALILFQFGLRGSILWLAGLIAVLVYLVDVKPSVTEVQRGPRW
jgi:hypothetical protein